MNRPARLSINPPDVCRSCGNAWTNNQELADMLKYAAGLIKQAEYAAGCGDVIKRHCPWCFRDDPTDQTGSFSREIGLTGHADDCPAAEFMYDWLADSEVPL